MTVPLWSLPEPPPGPLRRLLTQRLEKVREDGGQVEEDLALLTLSLADRIDAANAGGDRRGFVMLSSEYRQARDQLLSGVATSGTDALDAALADFLAAE